MKSELKWNELNDNGFTKVKTCNRVPTHTYQVTKPEGIDWPEDQELISWCDGGPGCNFGGRVSTWGKSGVVEVYVD